MWKTYRYPDPTRGWNNNTFEYMRIQYIIHIHGCKTTWTNIILLFDKVHLTTMKDKHTQTYKFITHFGMKNLLK